MNFFSRSLLIDVVMAIATVGSIIGFYYSVKTDFTWGVYGTLAWIVLAAFMVCARCRAEVENVRAELARCTAERDAALRRADDERSKREQAELSLALVPRAFLDEVADRITHGARSAWLSEIAKSVKLDARMASLRAIRQAYQLTSIQEQLNQVYLISCANDDERQYVHVDDTFTLTKAAPSGVRIQVAIVRVHQPINEQGTVVFRVSELLDEEGFAELATILFSEPTNRTDFAQYEICVTKQFSLSGADLECASKVFDFLSAQLIVSPEVN